MPGSQHTPSPALAGFSRVGGRERHVPGSSLCWPARARSQVAVDAHTGAPHPGWRDTGSHRRVSTPGAGRWALGRSCSRQDAPPCTLGHLVARCSRRSAAAADAGRGGWEGERQVEVRTCDACFTPAVRVCRQPVGPQGGAGVRGGLPLGGGAWRVCRGGALAAAGLEAAGGRRHGPVNARGHHLHRRCGAACPHALRRRGGGGRGGAAVHRGAVASSRGAVRAETCPPSVRGFLICLKECFLVVGMLMGFLVREPTTLCACVLRTRRVHASRCCSGTHDVAPCCCCGARADTQVSFALQSQAGGWRSTFVAAAPAALLLLSGATHLPESPRWLLLKAWQPDVLQVGGCLGCGGRERQQQHAARAAADALAV